MRVSLPIIRNGKQDKIYEIQVNSAPTGKKPQWCKLCCRTTLAAAIKYVKSLIGLNPNSKGNSGKFPGVYISGLNQDFVLESKHFRVINKIEYTTRILTIIDRI